MRKFLVVFVLLVLGLSAGAYIYYYKPFAPPSTMEKMLPGDTLAMMRVCRLNDQIQKFNNGKLGKALIGIDWTRLMTLAEIPPEIQDEIGMNASNLKTIILSPFFDSLFGEDMVMAILNANLDPDSLKQGNLKDVLDSMVAVTKPKHPAAIFDNLTSIFDTQLSRETHPYKTWEIVTIGLGPDLSMYYALNEELMIVALSAEPVQRCLDQLEDIHSSLAETPNYKNLGRGLFLKGQTDGQMYINAGLFFSKLGDLATKEAGQEPEMAAFKAQMEQMKGIESIHWVQYDDGSPVIRSKFLVGYDKESISPTLKTSMEFAPSANSTVARAPMNGLIYSWQNNFDLNSIWEEVKTAPDLKPEDLDGINQRFAMETGMNVDEFIGLFGKQFGVLLNDVKKGGMFPIPELALFIQIENPDKVGQLISSLAEKNQVALSQSQFKGTDIQQVMIPMGSDLSPSFTLSKGFLTVAVNRALLESMLDTTTDTCILNHPDIKALGNDLSGDANKMFYIQFKDVCEKSKDIIEWGLALMAITKPAEIQKLNEIVAIGVYPILDGLTMYKAVGGHMVNEESAVISEMRVLVDRE